MFFYQPPRSDPFSVFFTLAVVNGVMTLLSSLTAMIVLLGLAVGLKINDQTPVEIQAMVGAAAVWLYTCMTYVKNRMLEGIREWLIDGKEEAEGGQGQGGPKGLESGPGGDDEGS